MKKIYCFLSILVVTLVSMAQTPGTFNYQAVLRDAEQIISNTEVGILVSILQGSESGAAVFSESFTPTTNQYGIVSLTIGDGTLVSGDFGSIDWAAGPYFIETSVDAAGGTSYLKMGTSQLKSVPYALLSKNAENVFSGDYMDLSNTPAWSDSLDAHVENAVFLEGLVEVNNMLSYDGVNWIAKDIALSNTGGSQHMNIQMPYLALNYCIALIGMYPSRSFEPFVGQIALFGFNFAPRGWATCSGQLLSIAQNTSLFSLLGTIYGGDGRSTFGLPDLRGRVAIGEGTGPGLPNYRIGQKAGTNIYQISIANIPAHKHTVVYE